MAKTCYARFSAKRFEILVRKGWTDQECADFFDININTLMGWKEKHPEFLVALKAWKESPDFLVEKSLFERAMGIKYEEITREPRKSLEGETGQVTITKIVTKFIPPDTTACIFWLKNRKPEQWREKEIGEKPVDTRIIIIRDEKKPVIIEQKQEAISGRTISFNA